MSFSSTLLLWGFAPDRRPQWALRVHLLILAAAILVPLVSFSVWAVGEAVSEQRRGSRAHVKDAARATALFIESEIDTRVASLRALATSPLMGEPDSECRLHAWAADLGRAHGAWIVVSGPAEREGHPQLLNTAFPCGERRAFGGPVEALAETFRTARPVVANLHLGENTGRLMAAVVVPVVRDGIVVKAVSMPVEPAHLSERLRHMAPPGGLTLSLIDASRTVVARSHQAETLVGKTSPAAAVAAAEGRSTGFLVAMSADGRELAMGFQRLSSAPGWTVIAGMPTYRYEQALRTSANRLLGGAVLALLAVVLLGTYGAQRVLGPIRRLTEMTAANPQGTGLTCEPPLKSGISEFDRLAEVLAQRNAALARRVLEQERALAAVAREERRYRALAEAGTLTAWRAGPDGAIIDGHGWTALTGQSASDLRGEGWLQVVHPEDRANVARVWGEARADERPVDVEFRVTRIHWDGAWQWVRSRGVPIRGDGGGPIEEWVGVIEDAHERRSQEERQALLAREVDHRAKNALAVVQATLRLTRASDVSSFVQAVEGRVTALARAHNLLAEDRWVGADLRAVLLGELKPFLSADGSGPRAILEGPPVVLPPVAAQPIAMAIHELATNAVKHGALSVPEGRVTVAWSVRHEADPARRFLILDWTEQGGPVVDGAPSRRGFGSRVIQGTIRDQLGGHVSIEWRSSGLACVVEMPLRGPALGRV